MMLPIFAKNLSPEDYGIYETFIVLTTLISIISRVGVPTAILRFQSTVNIPQKKFLAEGIVILCIGSIIVIPTGILLSLYFNVFSWTEYDIKLLFVMMAMNIFLATSWEFAKAILQAHNEAIKISIITVVAFLILIIFKSYLILIGGLDVSALVYSDIVSNLFLFVISLVIVFSKLEFTFRQSNFNELLGYSIPTTFHRFNTWVSTYAHSIFIPIYLNASELGKFAIALKLLLPAVILIEAGQKAFFPLFIKARDRSATEPEEANRIIRLFFRLGILALISVLFIAPFLMGLLFDSRYHVDWIIFLYLIIGMFFNLLYRLLISEIFYQKLTKKIPLVSLISGCIVLTISYILVPYKGLLGSSISMALGSVSAALIAFLLFRTHIKPTLLLIDKLAIFLVGGVFFCITARILVI
jgi:O-antigen/teichoic acid export membrane protein